jgi:hypothetical protein
MSLPSSSTTANIRSVIYFLNGCNTSHTMYISSVRPQSQSSVIINRAFEITLRPLWRYNRASLSSALSMKTVVSRTSILQSHLRTLRQPLQRPLSISAAAMTKFDINTKYRMNSGYEIPVLGYGVGVSAIFPSIFKSPLYSFTFLGHHVSFI